MKNINLKMEDILPLMECTFLGANLRCIIIAKQVIIVAKQVIVVAKQVIIGFGHLRVFCEGSWGDFLISS